MDGPEALLDLLAEQSADAGTSEEVACLVRADYHCDATWAPLSRGHHQSYEPALTAPELRAQLPRSRGRR